MSGCGRGGVEGVYVAGGREGGGAMGGEGGLTAFFAEVVRYVIGL